jgi:hypothetical protein
MHSDDTTSGEDSQAPTRPGHLDLAGAAQRAGVTANEILAAAVDGAFPGALRLPGHVWLIPEEAVDAWSGSRN